MPLTAPPGFRGAFRADADARAVYSEGAGIARVLPAAVAVPANASDVRVLVAWAHDHRIALVPRGSGSGMAGGAVGSGVIVDLSRLRWMNAVDREAQSVRVGCGVLRDEVDHLARVAGLRFPVDPSSGAFCTVGGMAGTNAAGAHTLRWGSMRDWVRELGCVFDDGSSGFVRRGSAAPIDVPAIARFVRDAHPDIMAAERSTPSVHRGVRKESSGYGLAAYAASGELVDLLVGSEGTLALFTEIELRLEPVPASTASVLAAFRSLDDAVAAAVGARAAGAVACELLDRTFVEIAASGATPIPVPTDSEAVLLAELEGATADDGPLQAKNLGRQFVSWGATDLVEALDPSAEERLWAFRHAASPILSRLDPWIKSMQFIEDTAVPSEHLAEYVRGVRSILATHGVRGVIFGHAGDAHVHVNPLIDVRRTDWRVTVDAILHDVVALTASLGGTLSGEHGDGRLRTPLLAQVWNTPARERFALTKRAFDPDGILNPGVKVPEANQMPIGDVKYDPQLPPLPAAAAHALNVVERDRAYGSPRLNLLDDARGP